ncbi:type VI secretion system-associated protein TagF [Burkholderia sp. 22PA0099]|uniref:type VI secretion system-associated protein TagF n=1 Tax=Burkholderia sp. 22PA0099 TaxID=3237372 RepID=UPI0039C01C09
MSGVGFYGKLPAAGDFVRRRLPGEFVEGWDRHFQRALDAGRRELGARWDAAWRDGPVWRFVLPALVCGGGAWCGVIGPGVDRVGRAFPMVLAAPCAGDAARLFGQGAWFDALTRVCRHGQDGALDVEGFDACVAALPPVPVEADDAAARWRDLPWEAGQWQLTQPDPLAEAAVLGETWRQLGLRAEPWSLWWREGAMHRLAVRGLPRSVASLLAVPDERMAMPMSSAAQAIEPDWLPMPAAVPIVEPDWLPIAAAAPVIEPDWLPMPAAAPVIEPDWLPMPAAAPVIEPDWLADAPGDGLSAADFVLPPAVAYVSDAALLRLDAGRIVVLAADDGPGGYGGPPRQAARLIRETVAARGQGAAGPRAALMALHAQLRDAPGHAEGSAAALHAASHAELPAASPAAENGAAVVVRFDGPDAQVLRIGAAALWHWRRGQLRAPFVERESGAGGEFDDLLFGEAWFDMPGVGTPGEPDCDEASLRLEPGDRLLLLATRALTQLPRECLAQALDLPTGDDARAHLARLADLRTLPAQWPIAVLEVPV